MVAHAETAVLKPSVLSALTPGTYVPVRVSPTDPRELVIDLPGVD